MVRHLSLPGAHRVAKRLANGRYGIYWYRFRGGGDQLGRFVGDNKGQALALERDGFSAVVRAYALPPAKPAGKAVMRSLLTAFRAAPNGLQKLAPTTRAQWNIWLDKIDHEFGDLPLKLLATKGARRTFVEWRNKHAATPRSADYGIQVLRRVLAFGVEEDLVEHNPAEGITQLYTNNRADEIVSDTALSSILDHATPHARFAIRLAAATGIRRGDLVELKWDNVRPNCIVVQTSKSNRRTRATIPLAGDAAAVIEELREQRTGTVAMGEVPSSFVLTTEHGTPWKPASLTQAFIRAASKAGIRKRLHDLRGTAATRLVQQGFTHQEVARIMGWEPSRVDNIIERYVDPDRIVRSAIERLERKRSNG